MRQGWAAGQLSSTRIEHFVYLPMNTSMDRHNPAGVRNNLGQQGAAMATAHLGRQATQTPTSLLGNLSIQRKLSAHLGLP
jgi:hypothetical protein